MSEAFIIEVNSKNRIQSFIDTDTIFGEYITAITKAVQVNYEFSECCSRSVVCSDVISNIFLVLLKNGTSISVIRNTCDKAATLYTESLKLLRYCLKELHLKQITDIKKLVYMKTIGSFHISNENDGEEDDTLLVRKLIHNMKIPLQSLIQYTIEFEDTEISIIHMRLLMKVCFEVMKVTPEFALVLLANLQDTMQVEFFEDCSTNCISSLLVRYCVHALVFLHIFEQTRNVDITVLCFETTQLQDFLKIPLDTHPFICIVDLDDVRTTELYKNAIALLA